MAEASGKTKRLTLNLSLFPNLCESKPPNASPEPRDPAKSPRNFERGVVGLGIVAAMSDSKDGSDAIISAKSSRTAILALSPRSQPIPINPSSFSSAKKPMLEKDEMELSESYTCVISNFGNNLVKKREYFDDKIAGSSTDHVLSSGVFSASPMSQGGGYFGSALMVPFQAADFLHSCYLCRKTLNGLDIYMYRGEKAFCSAECRYKQISSDEYKESCGSGAMKPLDCPASPCSTPSPMLFASGVAAA